MLRTVFNHSLNTINKLPATIFRRIATYPTDSKEEMTVTDDGGVIVCWHPEKPFPYECSKPLPVQDAKPSKTILKMEDKEEVYRVFRNKNEEMVRQELMKLTFTTKHRWYPRSRDSKAKKTRPNRPYL
ncbi:large ribosomal subunit protein mL42 [Planococcus citri]|uniref:large ribosomal subunit protein mL42 n=1 Tax=Planococcus citri TaxID=170843 RepID=UPI0031F7F569